MIVDGEDLFEEPITIIRASAQSATPGIMKGPQKATTSQISSTAAVVSMDVAAKMFASGVLSAGDLVLQIRERLLESTMNVGGSQIADKVIYAGNEYRLVSRPEPVSFGDAKSGIVPFYIVHLRRSNSTSDTAGL